MPLPTLTPEQRAESLRKAAEVRKRRAEALDRLRKGLTTLAAVLADKDSPLQGAKVRQVLLAVPGVGEVTADKAITEIRIDPGRRVRGLGHVQRAALAERFAA